MCHATIPLAKGLAEPTEALAEARAEIAALKKLLQREGPVLDMAWPPLNKFLQEQKAPQPGVPFAGDCNITSSCRAVRRHLCRRRSI